MNTVLIHKPSRRLLVKECQAYRRRIRRLGWSQNEAARQIGRAPGLLSRWLRGEYSSAPMRQALDARLLEAEGQPVPPFIADASVTTLSLRAAGMDR